MKTMKQTCLFLVALAACTPSAETPSEQNLDPANRTRPHFIELMSISSGWQALLQSAGELAPSSIEVEDGVEYPMFFTTDHHALSLSSFGLVESTRSTSVPKDSCDDIPTDSEYYRSRADIEAEMLDIADLDGVEAWAYGTSFDGQPIPAIQFGPLNGDGGVAPALIIVATMHAREWISTGVALGLMRRLAEIVDASGGLYPDVHAALQTAAVVIVPVANPDGYDVTRGDHPTIPRDRSWRPNTNTTDCVSPLGVDLNRNFPTAFDEAPPRDCASDPDHCGCDSDYQGRFPLSEPESQALEDLMASNTFASDLGSFDMVALISLHSAGSVSAFPTGYKEQEDTDGFRCAVRNDGVAEGDPPQDMFDGTCFDADHQLNHMVFGLPQATQWYDPLAGEKEAYDSSRFVGFIAHGTLNLHAHFRPPGQGALSLLLELPGGGRGFCTECIPDADAAVLDVLDTKWPLVQQAITRLDALENLRTPWSPAASSVRPMGMMAREWTTDLGNEEDARYTWIAPVRLGATNADVTINGTAYPLSPRRSGAFYQAFAYDPVEHGHDPLKMPCCFVISSDADGEVDSSFCASHCVGASEVDLCDSSRLAAMGWNLASGPHGSSDDCWWTPQVQSGELIISPGSTVAPGSGDVLLSCSASFSLDLTNQILPDELRVEVETSPGVWENAASIDAPSYTYLGTDTRRGMQSLVYPLTIAPGGQQSYGVRLVSNFTGTNHLGELAVYDPIVYCSILGGS